MSRDPRYTIRREFCGFITAQHVVRFCGAWVGCAPDGYGARALQRAHEAGRRAQLRAWQAEADAMLAGALNFTPSRA